MGPVVFHITPRPAWEAAQATGRYEDPSLEREGFIHCSTVDQVVGAADAHFPGAEDLVLLCLDTDRLAAPLHHEYSAAGGGDFPHLYGPLNTDAVVAVVPLPPGDDGFTLPPEAERLGR